MPEPKLWKYQYLEYSYGTYSIYKANEKKQLEQVPTNAPKKKQKNVSHNSDGYHWMNYESK